MPQLPTYHRGDAFTSTAYGEVAAMISERSLAAFGSPFNLPHQSGLKQRISLINTLRFTVESFFGRFVNHLNYPGGILPGNTTDPTWTKQAIMVAAGIGGIDGFGNRNWTNIPPIAQGGDAWDLTNFISNLYGSTLIAGPKLYDIWLNEIIAVCRIFKYRLIGSMHHHSGCGSLGAYFCSGTTPFPTPPFQVDSLSSIYIWPSAGIVVSIAVNPAGPTLQSSSSGCNFMGNYNDQGTGVTVTGYENGEPFLYV